jgi:hypothetical protein
MTTQDNQGSKRTYFALFVVSTLARLLISTSNFSGYNNFPKEGMLQAPWGDFECHRTWMKVTTHLPIEKWYTNSSISNTSYWPMDYPPLCMHMHLVMGKSIEMIVPEAFLT